MVSRINSALKYATALSICSLLASCIDSDTTYNKILGSWESLEKHKVSCVTFTSQERYHLFQRFTKTDDALGVNYRAGYWNAGRGGRLWMRGTKIRDLAGRELTTAERVMDKGSWRVVEFASEGAWSAKNLEGALNEQWFTRVTNCDHFQKDVNMVFNDPVWPEEIRAKRLQEPEKD